ncbi:Hydroxymethylpyrimidine phosphate kinase ThiD [hydrothermal vent metagenome]|uniref:Hydroxymethylpyrimidine phosphate kinase ThiD n=1 Tax=hydrothermal vent metagenome TaxID=652676 RepID=A0A3B0VW57_9ZZZZ
MIKKNPPSLATVLTISGSDSSAGAGLQADLKTIHALGGYALTVATAITAQNSQGVSIVYPLPADIVEKQLQAIVSDYDIQAIKIGMLGDIEILKVVIHFLQQIRHPNVILDPVLTSSSGHALLNSVALPTFIKELLPQASLVTPNTFEVNTLLNKNNDALFMGCKEDIPHIAQELIALNIKAAVIKGGHSIDPLATDYLIQRSLNPKNIMDIQAYSTQRIKSTNTHGTGCTYASAVATILAQGKPLSEAVQQAKEYLFSTLCHANEAQPCYLANAFNTTKHRKGNLNHFPPSGKPLGSTP